MMGSTRRSTRVSKPSKRAQATTRRPTAKTVSQPVAAQVVSPPKLNRRKKRSSNIAARDDISSPLPDITVSPKRVRWGVTPPPNLTGDTTNSRRQAQEIDSSSPIAIRDTSTSLSGRVLDFSQQDLPTKRVPATLVEIRSSPPLPVDYPINLDLRFMVNKALKATPSVPISSRMELSLVDIERVLQPYWKREIDPYEPTEDNQQIKCSIRDISTKAHSKELIIDDFGNSAQDIVIDACDSFLQVKPKSQIRLSIEWRITINVKERDRLRKQAIASDPASQSSITYDEPPNTSNQHGQSRRASNLLHSRQVQVDAAAAAGSGAHRLRTRWRCRDGSCRNEHGTCYIDPTDPTNSHYTLDHTDIEQWAIKMNVSQATIEEPHAKLYSYLKAKGPFTGGGYKNPAEHASKVSTKQQLLQVETGIQGLIQMQTTQLQMTMTQSIQDNIYRDQQRRERLDREEERRQKEEERRLKDEEDEIVATQLRRNQLGSLHQPNRSVQLIMATQERAIGGGIRQSSPISTTDDDANIIKSFFDWKIAKINDEDVVIEFKRVYSIVVKCQWGIADLRAMSDTKSLEYREATEAGIQPARCRRFREELRAFKAYVREQEEEITMM
jgi:hypothetical protein